MHLRPVQFVDTPAAHADVAVARLAGGMQWFAGYEVLDRGRRHTVPVDEIASLGERAATLHARVTAPRLAWQLGPRTLRFDQPQVAGILNVTPDSFSDGGAHVGDPAISRAAAMPRSRALQLPVQRAVADDAQRLAPHLLRAGGRLVPFARMGAHRARHDPA